MVTITTIDLYKGENAMPEYRKEWFEKAKIDYFAPFVNLWLSCNSWYMDHYSEVDKSDRAHINKVKSDFSARNHLYKQFIKLIEGNAKENQIFKSNLQQLHFALENAVLESENIGRISFTLSVIDYNAKETKMNLLMSPRIKEDGTVFERDKESVIKLDTIYVTSDYEKLFAGIFEAIYQIRNCLIHGHMNPGTDEYEVVKYCYLVLYDLMSF